MASYQAQGLTAQISQQLGDAKRAILNRAPTSVRESAWLNSEEATTCKIKAFPGRTSEVVSDLSSKSGWLLMQDNIGHREWKKKWCSIVPHTFLYLYDDPNDISSSGGINSMELENLLTCGASVNNIDYFVDNEGRQEVNPARSSLKPSSIIDLQKYNKINKMQTGYVLELTQAQSDTYDVFDSNDKERRSSVSPLYFRGKAPEECDDWSESLLCHRYSHAKATQDELIRQNNDIRKQLGDYVRMMEEEEAKRKKAQAEVYNIKMDVQQLKKSLNQALTQFFEEQLSSNDKDFDDKGSNVAIFDDNKTLSNVFGKTINSTKKIPANRLNGNLHDECFSQRMHDKGMKCLQALNLSNTSSYCVNTNDGEEQQLSVTILQALQVLTDFARFLCADRMEMSSELNKAQEKIRYFSKNMIEKDKYVSLHEKLSQMNDERKKMIERLSKLEKEHKQVQKREKLYQQNRHELKDKQAEVSAHKTRQQEMEHHKILLKNEVLHWRSQAEKYGIRNSLNFKPGKINVTTNDESKMKDENFGLPPISNHIISSSSVKTTNHAPKKISANLSSLVDNEDAIISTFSEGSGEVYDDISIESLGDLHASHSFLSLNTSDEKIFQQLNSKSSKNQLICGKVTQDIIACGQMPQLAKKRAYIRQSSVNNDAVLSKTSNEKQGNNKSQISVFDSSTWMCGGQVNQTI